MADGKKEIVVRVVSETKGSSGGGGGGSNNHSLAKKTNDELEKMVKNETNLIQKKKILNELIKRESKLVGGVSDKAKDLGRQWQENQNKLAKFNKAVKTGSAGWGQAISSFQFKFNALGNIMANVTSAITRGFANAIRSIVRVAAEFESEMAAVRAISGATSEQFEKLRKDAIRLGGATIFTAKQVAELQTAYAKLGFTTQEILNATEATLDLAAATGEDLGEAAKIAGSTLRAFRLDATETQRVVDTMAKSFTSSALDLEKFRESMKFVAPVAQQAGFSIEETTAILAKLADTGLYGSLAGTSLRNIFLRMADSSSKLAQSVGGAKYGMEGLVSVFDELNKRGLNIAEALRLTDRRAVTAFATMSKAIPEIQKLDQQLKNAAGSAKEMANIRMDTFTGSVTMLKSAWEGFVLVLEDSSGFVGTFMRNLVDKTKELVDNLKIWIQTDEELREQFADEDAKIGMSEIFEEYGRITKKQVALQQEVTDKLAFLQRKKEAINYDNVQNVKKMYDELLVEYDKGLRDKYNIDQQQLEAQRANGVEWVQIAEDTDLRILSNTMRSNAKILGLLDDEIKAEYARRIEAKKQKVLDDLNIKREQEELRAEELEDNAKFQKKRQAALDATQQIRIAAIKNETIQTIASENERYRIQLRTLDQYHKAGLIKHYEYYNTIGDAAAGHQNKLIEIVSGGVEAQAKATADGMDRGKDAAFKRWADIIKENNKQIREAAEAGAPGEVAPNIFDLIGSFELTTEQESSLKEGISFVVSQLDYLAGKQKEYADQAVRNSERKVDQLQRDLEIEIELAEKGFASNVSLRQRELDDAKAAQERALAQQLEAQKKQERIEALSQAINLTSALSGILKSTFTKLDPVTALVVSAAASAAMIGMFSAWKNNIKAETAQYGEGGEIGGRKHSAGGTLIEAEQGEFVVRASEYAKNKELVNAINDGKLSGEWKTLNSDLNVSLDDTDTARLMNKHFGSSTQHFDWGRIEKRGNTIRKVRYA